MAVSSVLNSAMKNCATTIWRKVSPKRVRRWCSCAASGLSRITEGRAAASAPISSPTKANSRPDSQARPVVASVPALLAR